MKADGTMSSRYLLSLKILNPFLKFQQRNVETGVSLLFLTERDQGQMEGLNDMESDLNSSSVVDCHCDLRLVYCVK